MCLTQPQFLRQLHPMCLLHTCKGSFNTDGNPGGVLLRLQLQPPLGWRQACMAWILVTQAFPYASTAPHPSTLYNPATLAPRVHVLGLQRHLPQNTCLCCNS